jgi:uncharacterized C2H2 Zn-finger protein
MATEFIATCPLCGFHFTDRALLELHVRKDHSRPDPRERRGRDGRAAATAAGPR